MGIIQKQATWSTIITYFGVIIGFVNVVFLFTSYLSPEEMGLRGVLFHFCVLFHHVGVFGFSSVATRYFPKFENDSTKNNGFLSLILGAPLLIFSLATMVLIALEGVILRAYEDESQLFVEYFYLVYPITFSMIIMQVFESYASVQLRTVFPTFVKEVILKGGATCVVLLYAYAGISSTLFWELYSGTYAVGAICVVIYAMTFKSFSLKMDWQFYKGVGLKGLFTFAGFMVVNSFASLLVLRIDLLMISSMKGEFFAGIYVIGIFMSTVIEIPRKSISKISSQLISSAWNRMDLSNIQDIYKKASEVQLISGIVMFLIIVLNLGDFYQLIPKGEIYAQSFIVIVILGLTKLVDMVFSLNSEVIGYSKYYKFNLVSVLILAVLAIVSNYYLIDLYGIEGAAIASFGSILIFNLLKFVYIKLKFDLQPFSWKTPVIVGLGVSVYIIVSFMPSFAHPIISASFRSVLILVLFITPVYLLKLSQDFNNMTEGIIDKIKKLF